MQLQQITDKAMHAASVVRLLASDTKPSISRYAIVDCAATARFEDDDEILKRLSHPEVEKQILFTGENARAIDHVAPYLLPLDSQPELEEWLLENGWGNGWAIFFTSDAGTKTLLAHFRTFFELQAPNGRDTFFRFYAPPVLGDFLPLLNAQEALAFFGPVQRFVIETGQGEPAVFDRPQGRLTDQLAEKTDPSKIVFAKREQFSKRWRDRLLGRHVKAYGHLGFNVTADAADNALTIQDKAGATARLQKTKTGVEITTGEQRKFQYELTTCKHPAAIVDPAGNRIELDIQERDNKEKRSVIPMLNAIRMEKGEKTWVFDYDDMEYLQRIDYPDGTRATIAHDSYGNLAGVTNRNGHTTRYEYDFNQLLTTFEDANGHATRFDYEGFAAPSTIAFADGQTFNFEYTDAGALAKFLAGNTQVASYDVDTDSGSWTVNYTDGGQAEFEIRDNKIVRAANAAGTVELAYDDAGHLIKETFQNRSVTYHRNPTGQLTGITTPFGQTIHYRLDGENRVCAIKDWTGRTIDIQYALNGALERITYPNGTRLEQQTNAQGLPTQMHLSGPQGTLFCKTFQRDRLNRITQINDGEHQAAFDYDKEGRLLKAGSQDHTTETFTLDAQGSRLADNTTQYTINTADRLTQAGPTPFAYDSLGNLTQGTSPLGRADYAYTDLNRLKSISLKNTSAQYLYDAFGRRVAKNVNGTTTHYYWAQAQLLHEAQTQPAGSQKSAGVIDYLFFPQTPVLLAIRQNSQIRWAAFGHRYEVLSLTNAGGHLVWQARYDAFGKAHIEIGEEIHQPFRLAGQYYDAESGLHYNLARYYDPGQGRFLCLDPLFIEGGSTNFYTYCNGDPINHIDPSGELIFCLLIGAAIGAALGAGIGGGLEAMRQSRSNEKTDGYKIAKAALIGGAIGAIGGTAGAAVEAAAAAGAMGTVMAASTLPAMGGVGFLSGAGASAAEQCAEAQMTGNGIDPLSIAKQALTDGVIGAGTALVTFGVGGFAARRLRKASALFRPRLPAERAAKLARKNKHPKSTQSPGPRKRPSKNATMPTKAWKAIRSTPSPEKSSWPRTTLSCPGASP